MRTIMRQRNWIASAIIALGSACEGSGAIDDSFSDGGVDEVGLTRAAVITSTFNPPISLTTTGSVQPIAPDLPNPLPGTGGTFLPGSHLNTPPDNVNAGSASDAWVAKVEGDRSLTPGATRTRLNEALADARSYTDSRAIDWGGIRKALEKVSAYVGVKVTSPSTPSKLSFGYAPERARWLDAERTSASATTRHADPARFSELRERGARLYCAAKQAHAQPGGGNGSHIMGRKSLATFKLLGEQIDLISVEPTVAMSAPQKMLSFADDGTQAFTIPMAVGARLSPASFLPTLPELRTPVTLVTSDSETLARDNNGRFPSRDWQTATHADAFVTATQKLSIDPDSITLFYIGPVEVSLDMKFDVGAEACSQAGNLSSCTGNRFQRVSRLLDTSYAGWPAARTGGETSGGTGHGTYNDTFWRLQTISGDFWPGGLEALRVNANPLVSPMGVRALQSNDKSVEIRTNIAADMRLNAGFSRRVGPVYFEIDVDGGLKGTATVVHAIREQEHIGRHQVDEFVIRHPETSLSVTPRTEANLDFVASANAIINLTISVFGRNFEIPFGGKLFDEKKKIAAITPANWPETNRLRLGTKSAVSPRDGFLTSHWPQQSAFEALPDSIASCLLADERTGTLSDPCGSVDQNFEAKNVDVATTQPRTQVCMFTPNENPDWEAGNAAAQCMLDFHSFARKGRSFVAPGYVSRVVDPNDTRWPLDLKVAAESCVLRLGVSNVSNLNRFISTGLCSENGRLATGNVLEVETLTNDGPGTRSASGKPAIAPLPNNACRRPK